jgi:UPF0755 protein
MSGASNSRSRRNRWLRRILIYGSLVVAALAAWLAYALLVPYQGFPREGVFVEVPRGASARAIARLLEEKGVVRSSVAFELLARWHARERPAGLQAGEYHFSRPLTPIEVHRWLAEGRVYVHVVTVPEGYTMFDIANLFEREELTHRENFLAAARDPSAVRDLAPEARNLEGFLFPATYQFSRRVTAEEIVGAMVKRFREVWKAFPAEGRNPQRLSVLRLVTLASLVEREARLPDERLLVSGVFYNRLRRHMALQCDPTVLYALRLAGKPHSALTTADLQFNSPYNTYRFPGLPPGPIANPGEASLRVALYPPKTDYLYFVSDTRGGHFFSRTIAEHNANVARYRRMSAAGAGQDAGRNHLEKTSEAPGHPGTSRSLSAPQQRGRQ